MEDSFYRQFRDISDLLKDSRRVLVAAHENPDPDAVSSVLAVHRVLIEKNKESFPFLPDPAPRNLSYLPGFFEIKQEIGSFRPDLLFCLDYGDFKRLRLPSEITENPSLKIITLDHHVQSDQRGEVKIVEPEFSSAAEIVYYWLKHENIEIDRELASCLLAGIISDSGGLKHVCTGARTMRIVSELISKGISLNKTAGQTLAFQRPLDFFKAWGKVLSGIEVDGATGLAYSSISLEECRDFGINLADFDGVANLISSASPRNFGLFLVEYEKGKVKGSLRSEPHGGVNVVRIAKALGGGGHPYAAGFQQEAEFGQILKKVLNLVE